MAGRLVLAVTGLAASGSLALGGCVAAVPVLAAASVANASLTDQSKRKKVRRQRAEAPKPGEVFGQTPDGKSIVVTNLTGLPAPDGSPSTPVATPGPANMPPPEMQYLYGSGEAAALSLQAYQTMWHFLHNEIGYRRDKTQIRSVILSPGATIESPKFDLCGQRPLAVVLDIDETALLNLGFEGDSAARGGGFDAARWARWEATGAADVVAVPGAAETLAAARREGITVVFNSNRSATYAAQTAAALDHAGLGPAVLGETLWLRGEGEASGKDARRQQIAKRYCVVAMAGDQLGDFSDLFNAADVSVRARRNGTTDTLLAPLWGAGWFMLPNPVYGTGLKGSVDEVFPADTRWSDPEEKK